MSAPFPMVSPVCMKLFCVNFLLQPVSTDTFSKACEHRNSPNERMCAVSITSVSRSFAAYIRTSNGIQQWDLLDLPPFLRNVLRYVRTRRISVKPIYMRSCHSFHTHKSPHPPSGRVGDVVAMFQIESPGIGNHGVAEAAGFQRCKGIFFAPHPVDFIEILGTDGRIRFTLDVSLGIHEIKDIVVVTLDRFFSLS